MATINNTAVALSLNFLFLALIDFCQKVFNFNINNTDQYVWQYIKQIIISNFEKGNPSKKKFDICQTPT